MRLFLLSASARDSSKAQRRAHTQLHCPEGHEPGNLVSNAERASTEIESAYKSCHSCRSRDLKAQESVGRSIPVSFQAPGRASPKGHSDLPIVYSGRAKRVACGWLRRESVYMLVAEVAGFEVEEEIACCWIEERKKGKEKKVD